MKRILLWGFLCLLFGQINAQDSLKLYNPNIPTVILPSTGKLYAFRVDVPQPLTIRSIKLRLDGSSADGELKMELYGHEGGTSFPQLEKTLFGPYTVKKSQSGYEEIEVKIEDGAYFNNDQFFIVLHSWSEDVRIIAEASVDQPSCESGSGGNYYHLFGKGSNDQWYLPNRKALAIDLLVDYESMPDEVWMKDLTEIAGIDKTLRNKNMVVGDLNGDDFLDLMVDGHVYFNEGGFKFTDQTPSLGYNSSGLAAHPLIDINNDGLLDILLLYTDSIKHQVLINQGSGQFSQQAIKAQIPVRGISSFSIADIDLDGFPDLFIGRLWTMYPSGGPDIVPNYLFKNDGKNDFTDATSMIYSPNWKHRRSRGSAWCDYDNDGDLDLFVANYFLEPDELWRNNGDGTFTDVANVSGIDVNKNNQSSHGTGCDWGDYNNDGNMDLLVPMLAHPGFTIQYDHLPTSLYRNGGKPAYLFYNETASSGIQYEETHAGGAWADMDNDGLLDFAITTFYGCRYIELYRQVEKGKFELVTNRYGMEKIVTGEDACWADFDNDGKLDLLMGEGGRVRLYKNDIPVWHHHFVQIELMSDVGNKLAIGSRVEVYAGGERMIREVTAGRGVRMQKPARLHFGIGTHETIDSVRVRWFGETDYSRIQGIQVDQLNYVQSDGSVQLNIKDIQKEAAFRFWPNPTFGKLNIVSEQQGEVSIWTLTGQQLHTLVVEKGKREQIHLDLKPGVYLIKAPDGKLKRLVITSH